MRPNPAELAAWTAENARARMAYDADKQVRTCQRCPTPLPDMSRRICDACAGPPKRICPTCNTSPMPKRRRQCEACESPRAAELRAYRADKKASR